MPRPLFTPGPYRAEGPDMFGDFNILHNGDALAVAAVVSNLRPPAEVAANAHLHAAAPDLYDWIATIENDDGKLPDWLWQQREALLAKARGEQL
jgi:hypothetical protein